MSFNFLGLPLELRTRIYELLLVEQKPIQLVIRSHELTLGLLRANKMVYQEARALLYSKNHFDFVPMRDRAVVQFLGRISPENASCIRHLEITFPVFSNLAGPALGDIALTEDSTEMLANIQRSCPKLCSLSMWFYCSLQTSYQIEALEDVEMATAAMDRVNIYLKALPALQDVVVELLEYCPEDSMRQAMESYEWIVKKAYEDDDLLEWSMTVKGNCQSSDSAGDSGGVVDDDDVDSDIVVKEVDA